VSEADQPVRLRTHPGLCLGWGECHRWAPDVYPLDDDGKVAVHLLEVPAELGLIAWLGARACPERAITVIGSSDEHWVQQLRDTDTLAALQADDRR
jgi:ferredoxin